MLSQSTTMWSNTLDQGVFEKPSFVTWAHTLGAGMNVSMSWLAIPIPLRATARGDPPDIRMWASICTAFSPSFR